jgi:hypothetical protein
VKFYRLVCGCGDSEITNYKFNEISSFILHCSNPAEEDEFLGALEIRSTISFGGEVKPLAPCYKISRHVKHERDTCRQNSRIFRQVYPVSLLGISAGYRQETLVAESGKIRNQVGKKYISNGRGYRAPCAMPPCKQ